MIRIDTSGRSDDQRRDQDWPVVVFGAHATSSSLEAQVLKPSVFSTPVLRAGSYCVLANVFTPQGLSGATFTPDGGATGGDFFDVVGDPPNNVVYNDGSHDVIGWVP